MSRFTHRRTRARLHCALMDVLESRRLLAVSVTGDGTLLVEGASGNDDILFETSSGGPVSVRLNGATTTFQRSEFQRILARGLDGNDVINVLGTFGSIPTTLEGGNGLDTFDLHDSNASVSGGAGGDQIILRLGSVLSGFSDSGGVDTINTFSSTAMGGTFNMNNFPFLENLFGWQGVVEGNALNNEIEAHFQGATLRGNGGNDTLRGLDSPDLLVGGAGNDSLQGGGGNDTLDGSAGADTLKGGGGNDTADYSSRTAPLTIGPGTLPDDGEAGEKDNVANDIETILGGSGSDHIKGTAAANLLVGNGGNDTLLGFEGNDTLSGNAGTDRLDGSAGTDVAINAAGDTLISIEEQGGNTGQPTATITADDTLLIRGTAAADNILIVSTGGNVHVHLSGAGGAFLNFDQDDFTRVLIEGFDGNDRLELDDDADPLGKPVTMNGGGGQDTLIGGTTHDILLGASGFDSLEGGGGNDTLDGGANGDLMKGGAGNDTVTYAGRTGNVTVGLGTANDDGEAGERDNVATDVETVIGGAGNDTISATNAGVKANLLVGNGGDDSLFGGGGNDTLSGNAGEDTLNGGDGFDTATNAAGDITFNIESGGGGSGTAVITPDRTLLITGTDAHDDVSMTMYSTSGGFEGELVTINGAEHTFDFDDFDRIQIDLRGGHDSVQLHVTQFDNVTINAGDGNDNIDLAVANAEVVNGGAGDDELRASDGSAHFVGGSGTDTYDDFNLSGHLDLRLMPDVENGIVFNGTLHGNDLPNVLQVTEFAQVFGHGGDDLIIVGGDEPEVLSILHGDAGNDTIFGGPSGDSIFGDAGNDFLDGRGGGDTMQGGDGNDTVDYSFRTSGVRVGIGTLADDGEAGEGDNVYLDVETVIGGSGNDTITGGAANNRLVGNGGNDSLRGNFGDDTLVGGSGTDMLNGEGGNDTAQDASGDILISIENS